MRTAVGVVLALSALAGCFSDNAPQLSTAGDPSEATTTTTTTSTTTDVGPTSTTTTGTTGELTTTTGAATTGPCPLGQPESSWYLDGDGDGFGAGEPIAVACDPPPGTVEFDGDCDDAEFAVNPGVDEVCNALVDDDCDGLRDEYSPSNGECGNCRLSEQGDATFWTCAEPNQFLGAEARCQEFGAPVHLAHPSNTSQLGFVRDQILLVLGSQPPELHFWIGLHRQEALWNECTLSPEPSDWVAVDGLPLDYFPWRDGEPNNEDCGLLCNAVGMADSECRRENCVEIGDGATGVYNDLFCGSMSTGIVCQAPLAD